MFGEDTEVTHSDDIPWHNTREDIAVEQVETDGSQQPINMEMGMSRYYEGVPVTTIVEDTEVDSNTLRRRIKQRTLATHG